MKTLETVPFVTFLVVGVICAHHCVTSEKILFFFGLSTYSHRITAWPLATKLAEQGHSVTFLQAVKNKNPHPKVQDIIPEGVEHVVPSNFVEHRLNYGIAVIYVITLMLPQIGVKMCDQFLNNTKNVEWVENNKFDLVVVDALFNDCAYGLAYKWEAKTIGFGTTHVFDWFPDVFGFPDECATAPSILFATDMPLGFFGRVKTSLSYLYMYFNREFRGIWPLDSLLRQKLLMPSMPPVAELVRNTSLILLNSHFSEELPRSLPPLVVPVGGMHVSETVKPLPKDMEEFVKGAGDDGFIYVSFGSEADMAKSPENIRQMFWNSMGKSKTRFLWRWNGERPKEMPKNVMTASWIPQQDVLGHPKCKGFITHGGLLSMQEAVYHGVPMIVFPIFAEQDYNAERLQRTGRGIRLEIGSLTQEQLDEAITRLLSDSSLKHQMQLASIRFKDRPMKPVDSALWWVHYVLRHEDTSFLRPLSATSLNWYERRQLDVWAFLTVSIFIFAWMSLKIVGICLRLCFKGSSLSSRKTDLNKKLN